MTDDNLQNVEYNEILFRGKRILEQKEEDFKNLLISSSFSAWQMLSARGHIKTEWRSYLKHLNLLDDEVIAKGELKRDYENAIEKSKRIMEKAKTQKR